MAEDQTRHAGSEGNSDDVKNIHPVPSSKDLEREDVTDTQKNIEKKVTEDEKTFGGSELSTELSKDRTHMSEHRTALSEHRTDLSEHRTALSEHRTELSDHRTALSEHRTALSEHRSSLSQERTGLSFERTALSYERTLMSWIRTATSMISFGFTIYKFFEEFQKQETGPHIFTPRVVGLMMIGFGVIGLLFAEIQHIVAYKKLKKEYPELRLSLSSVLAALLLAIGLLLFFAALFRQ